MPKKRTNEICDCKVIHEEVVKRVNENIPNDHILINLANLYKIIGDPTRVKILYTLEDNELCVCDICVLLNMTQSAISHQLKVLKNARIVKNRREGKNVFYSLDDDHIRKLFSTGLEHIKEEKD